MEELIMKEFDKVLQMRGKWHEASEREETKGINSITDTLDTLNNLLTTNSGIGQAYFTVRGVKDTARKETAAVRAAMTKALL